MFKIAVELAHHDKGVMFLFCIFKFISFFFFKPMRISQANSLNISFIFPMQSINLEDADFGTLIFITIR